MDIKSFIRVFVTNYFIILALTVIVSICYLYAQNLSTLETKLLVYETLFALAADAPLVVYISKDELSATQYRIRVVIHAVLLEAILMPIGYFIGMWNGAIGGVVFFLTVLAVDVAVHLINYLNGKLLADDLNDAIKKRRIEDKGEAQAFADNPAANNNNAENSENKINEEK